MTKELLKVLLVGAGNRGDAYTVALNHLDFIRVSGICEPNKLRRQKYIKKQQAVWPGHPIKEYIDWKDGLEDTDEYDAVFVCVLDDMHREVAVAYANKGKHILCEKPLATHWDDCKAIYSAIDRNNLLFAVGHVLRYSPHNLELKKILDAGTIGEVINMNHTEPVGWYHFAHSYVRGNWRRTESSTFSLMAKCCHDIDVLMWIFGWQNLKRVTSFGSLSYFKKENKPEGAGDRCLSCPIEADCGYSAKKTYLDDFLATGHAWKTETLTDIEDAPHLIKALEEGPYGKCVFDCDNDVCDNQVVSLDFGNKTATMTMIAMSKEVCNRKMILYGTRGEISSDSRTIEIFDYATQETTKITPPEDAESGHGGGDRGLAHAFAYGLKAVLQDNMPVEVAQKTFIKCTANDALVSHKVVFLAEQSRLKQGQVHTLDDEIYL